MLRKAGWEERLSAVFAAARIAHGIIWGQHDCLLFAADSIDAVVGTSYGPAWRGRYDSEAGALEAIRLYCGTGEDFSAGMTKIAAKVANEIGARPISPGFARRGDAALVAGQMHEAFAIVDETARRVVTVSPKGLLRLPLSAALRLWAVGN